MRTPLPSVSPLPRHPDRFILAVLVAILCLAAATRFYKLETRSLWEDEGWTLLLSRGPAIPDIVRTMANDQHPPLYFLAIHYWRDLAGSTEFGLRALSVFFGIIAVAVIYQIGKQMFDGKAGIAAAFVLALADLHIDLSQDVRHYAPLALFILLSCWFYFRLIQKDRPSRGTRLGYFLTSAALLYTNYLGGFVLICQVVHMLLMVRPRRRLWVAFFHFGAACAAFLAWFPIVVRQNQVRWETPLYYLNSLPDNEQTYRMVRDALLGRQYAITLILLGIGIVGFVTRSQWKSWRRSFSPVLFLLLWLVGYIVMTFYLNSIENRQFLTIRNFVVATPAIALLLGRGIAILPSGVRAYIVVVWLVMSLSTYDTHQLKPPWREVTQNVTALHNEGEPVLMDIWVGDFSVRYYVEQQMGTETPWLSLRELADEYETQFLPVLKSYLGEQDAFWLIFWGEGPSPYDYEFLFDELGFRRTASPYIMHEGARLYSHRYDRFADADAYLFYENGVARFALRKSQLKGTLAPGETVEIDLWWTAETPPPADFSVSVFLQDSAGIPVVQVDGPPQNKQGRTSTWQVGELQYDPYTLLIPENLPPGIYEFGVRLYFYLTPESPLLTQCDTNREGWCTAVLFKALTIE